MKAVIFVALFSVTVALAVPVQKRVMVEKKPLTRGFLCNLCKDFVGALEQEIINDESNIKQVD